MILHSLLSYLQNWQPPKGYKETKMQDNRGGCHDGVWVGRSR